MRQTEKQIEARLVERVKCIGGKILKFNSPSLRGVPDRIVFLPGGRVCLVELKKPGEKLRAQQEKRKREFEDLGFKHYVIDSYEKIERFINEIQST